MATESDALAAVLAAINADLPPTVRAYDADKVPTARPLDFVTVSVARRSGGTARSGRYSTEGWAAYVMGASKTSSSNARNSLRLANGALENRVLTVGSEKSTPVRFENGRPVAPDDGWSTGVNTYHFAT